MNKKTTKYLIILAIIVLIIILAVIIGNKIYRKKHPNARSSIIAENHNNSNLNEKIEGNKIITEYKDETTGENIKIEEDKDNRVDKTKKYLIKIDDTIYQKTTKINNYENKNKIAESIIKSIVEQGKIPNHNNEANNKEFLNAIVINSDNSVAILRIKDEVWQFNRIQV